MGLSRVIPTHPACENKVTEVMSKMTDSQDLPEKGQEPLAALLKQAKESAECKGLDVSVSCSMGDLGVQCNAIAKPKPAGGRTK
ncbi:MAG: hypothetical protein V4735_06780 [Pseudomonadota bacterium]